MRQESIEKTWLYAMSTRPPLLPPPTSTAARGNCPLGRPTTTTTITTATTKCRCSLYVCGSLHSSLHPATHKTINIASSSHPQAPVRCRLIVIIITRMVIIDVPLHPLASCLLHVLSLCETAAPAAAAAAAPASAAAASASAM